MESGPLSGAFGYTRAEIERVRAELAAKGIRELPYPFSSAISIVSDADSTKRIRYDAYCDAFLGLGLDFGDSTFLRWSYQDKLRRGAESGFFSRDFSIGLTQPARAFERTRTFYESIIEFHKGNLDHFHSFLSGGPKVVLIRIPAGGDGDVELQIGTMPTKGLWRASDLDVMGVLVVGGAPSAITLGQANGQAAPYAERTFHPPAGGHARTLFLNTRPPEDETPIPRFLDVRGITVHGGAGVEYVILLSVHARLLIDRIEYLRSFGVEMNLITEHSRLHFRNPRGGELDDRQTAERLMEPAPILAVCGRYEDKTGVVFSTDSDDPESVVRVLPDLFGLGVRFLIVAAAESAVGFTPLTLLSPTPTRAGGGGYWARRCLPNQRDPPPGQMWDGTRTRMESFTTRLRRVLAHTEGERGLVWPIYTHLGGMDADDSLVDGSTPNPHPYLDLDTLHALQDRALGISGNGARIWFSRPSTLYDYALMLRSVGNSVKRSDNDIAIASWHDAVLDQRLPCSPAQLYGLTFFVEDSAAAQVSLDEQPIETLIRNPADESGRESVTIAECEIRYPVFHWLDPARGGDAEIDGAWGWENGVGRIDGRIKVALHGWTPVGAQLFAISARGAIGVLIETQTGGRFFLGDAALAPQDATATYFFPAREDWRRVVAPFHGLDWAGRPGGPVPSNPLAAVTILGDGEVARPEFLRPRATTLERGAFCVAGRVPSFHRGQIVTLEPVPIGPDQPDRDEQAPSQTPERFPVAKRVPTCAESALGAREMAVDQRGAFCFSDVPPGVHALRSGDLVDRRGPLVEVVCDTVNLELDRSA